MSKPTNYNFTIITGENGEILNFQSESRAEQKANHLKKQNKSYTLLYHIGDGIYRVKETYWRKSKRGKYGKQQQI